MLQALTQNPSSVYYLHPYDSENFGDWKRMVVIGLTSKKKMCFVDGTLPKPTGVTEAIAWDRANNMVCGWILRSLGPATAKSVLLLRIARDAWKDLEDRFGHSSVAQLYSLQQELLNMSRGNGDISTFFTKMKVLWDQLDDANPIPYCECGACTCNLTKKFMKIQHDQCLVHFLMKLKEAYQQVRSNVLMMEVDAPLSQAYKIL